MGGGAVAAVVAALTAALVTMAARASHEDLADAPGLAAQSEALRRRASALAEANQGALAAAVEALRDVDVDDVEDRLGRALWSAAEVPLDLAALAADVAELASVLAQRGRQEVRPDAVTASVLAAAVADAAAHLVSVNLTVTREDPRVADCRAVAAAAARSRDAALATG
jgi:formiminotetrahydrofolate cyclodeaminase